MPTGQRRANVTFGSVLEAHRGIGPGFDLLRIALAALIFIGHAKWIGGAKSIGLVAAAKVAPAAAAAGPAIGMVEPFSYTTPIRLFMVPAFFALSGFLVMGSALRLQRTSTFLANRALRIFPALMVEVALSALVLGPIFTTLPPALYFTHPEFLRYFGNAVGEVTMLLPGVFRQNHATAAVNVNLWTLPSEFWCYAIMAAAMLTGLAYRRLLFSAAAAAAIIATAAYYSLSGSLDPGKAPHLGNVIVIYFVVGALAYHWRSRLPVRWSLFLLCAGMSYVLLSDRAYTYLAIPFVVYATLFVGMIRFPRVRLLQSGDYSYGLYLFGFPITQALAAAYPSLQTAPVSLTLIAGLLSCGFAWASWHLIEKNALALRRKLPERWFPTTPRQRLAAVTTLAG
jgi:peptidoglycan/LPS O-acetylase OafA/YrhL